MIITSVTPHLFEYVLPSQIADARNTIAKRSCLLVEITTDEGLTGWGEAATFAGCGPLVAPVVRFFAERLVGKPLPSPADFYHACFGSSLHFGRRGLVLNALSGIDIALWDIKGKLEGQSLVSMLGAARPDIEFYFNGGYFVDDDPHGFLKTSVETAVARGAQALKIKIGQRVEDDIQRIQIARDILGPDRDLMVDANGILNIAYLRNLNPTLVKNNIRWMEEPVAITRVSELQSVKAVLDVPVAGYELEQTASAWAELIEGNTVDIAQPDSIWSGGITECIDVAATCAAHEVEFVPHNFASIVCLAANAHLAAHAPTGGWLEVDSNDNPFLWAIDTDGGFKLENGRIKIPDTPGIGVTPNIAAIEKYRIPV